MTAEASRKILFVRHLAFGDVLMTTPFLRQVRTQASNVVVDLYSEVSGAFDGLDGYRATLSPKTTPAGAINSLPYDETLWFSYEHAPDLHILDGYQQSTGIVLSDRRLEWVVDEAESTKARLLLNGLKRPLIGLSPACRHALRNLDPLIAQELIDALNAQFGGTVVVTDDRPLEWQSCANLCGKIGSIRELAAVIAECDGWIGIDSGPLHLAQALKKPTVGLFGCVLPELRITDPATIHVVRNESLDCLGCYHRLSKGRKYPHKCARGDHACMTQISPERIVEALQHVMAGSQDSGLAQRMANYETRWLARRSQLDRSVQPHAISVYRKIVMNYNRPPGFLHRLERSVRLRFKQWRQRSSANRGP